MSDVTSLIYAMLLIVMGLGVIIMSKPPAGEEAAVRVPSETPTNEHGGYDG
jgi:hypothetical protein